MIIPSYKFDAGEEGMRPPRGTACTYLSHDLYVFAEMNSSMQADGKTLAERAAQDPRRFFSIFFTLPFEAEGAAGVLSHKDPSATGSGYDIDSRQIGMELADQLIPSIIADPDIVPIGFELRRLLPGFDFTEVFAEGDQTAVMEKLLRASSVMIAFTLEPPSLA